MCGINGIYAYHYAANPIDRAELARTRDHMDVRGPDGKGEWISSDGRVGFGHRRLAIIDLSDAGAQPMASADGKLVVTFNGEIYNYRELRSGLEGKGYVFSSRSDTEVLLHLYADKGEAMVHDLRGMFAFAIWDGHNDGLARLAHALQHGQAGRLEFGDGDRFHALILGSYPTMVNDHGHLSVEMTSAKRTQFGRRSAAPRHRFAARAPADPRPRPRPGAFDVRVRNIDTKCTAPAEGQPGPLRRSGP